MELPRYIVLEKAVGQTPLQCMEAWRANHSVSTTIPLTYAGRLDPMASGKLLVLIGEECKKKDEYLALDKTYQFSVLLGIGSDTHDVLGRLQTTTDEEAGVLLEGANHVLAVPSAPERSAPASALTDQLSEICKNLVGNISLPYPHFSSKTVRGKPLHMWTLEGRLNEIEIPTKASTIYSLELHKIETLPKDEICNQARTKIDTISEVTDKRKQLGADFRRTDVRQDWEDIAAGNSLPRGGLGRLLPAVYTIAHFNCTASSGTYMRTLAKLIGEQLDPSVPSLAWHINRTKLGKFTAKNNTWSQEF